MDDKYKKVAAILAFEGELGQAPEKSDGNLIPYPEGGNASVSRKGYAIKSGYLTFYPGSVSTMNWWLNQGQVSEYSRYTRVNPSSDPSEKPTGLSYLPLPEESCNRLICTTRMGDYQLTRGIKRLTQCEILDVNLDESSSIPSVKGGIQKRQVKKLFIPLQN